MRYTSLIILALSASLIACGKKAESQATDSKNQTQDLVGNEGPNGGNFEAQEAARLSGELLVLVKQSQPAYPEVDWANLEAAVRKTKIFMAPVVVVRGQETDASNNGVDEIQISSSRWKLKTERLAKIALLFHEYLGILGLEINNYGISNRIINPAFNLASGIRYSCGGHYFIAMKARYNVTSDTYYFAFDGVDEKGYQAKYGNVPDSRSVDTARQVWGWETCGSNEFLGRKVGGSLSRIGACQSGYRSWDQLEFLDDQGLFFSQAKDAHTMACFPMR
ncbi:MAG: hypothetical protein EOP05_01420 [Proteobacteria bacterium]|nr:MAG: hypothetical protein EOP05_01420 [Pseudomonadota bacterium]